MRKCFRKPELLQHWRRYNIPPMLENARKRLSEDDLKSQLDVEAV
jgi:hypothetical protein